MGNMNVKHSDYPYIELWGQLLGSFGYYIDGQIAKARQDNAPKSAIFKSSTDGTWHTVEGVTHPETRFVLTQMCERDGVPVPQWQEPATSLEPQG